MKNKIKVIGFDADDTLWDNQPQFDEVIKEFCSILNLYCPKQAALERIHEIQVENLPVYGFGAKSLTLSMVQVACELSAHKIDGSGIERIIALGKKLLTMSVCLMDSAEEVIRKLKDNYRLVLITKGDLIDQQRKLRESGLEKYFHHIEILSDKKLLDYKKLFDRLNLNPEEFAMIGNSLKSDIQPVLKLNAYAVYIPYHATWEHEKIHNFDTNHLKFTQVERLKDLLDIFSKQ
jgi:putative hydrolase of the HAD superfamily